MANNYRTPGVYVEEISKFPPSVAQVETAIPAFIGYTQQAQDVFPDDLHLVPTRITSLLEYENYFGSAQKEEGIEVDLNETLDNNGKTLAISATVTFAPDTSNYNMYYAMQLFFVNGGGPCYIISVGKHGKFPGVISDTDLKAGLDELEKMDEPTMIIFPEGQNITDAGKYYALQDESLQLCAKLQDRFAVMDVHDVNGNTSDIDATGFRGGIGLNNLKYGAAYYPNLITTLAYSYDETKVTLKHLVTGSDGKSAAGGMDTKKMSDAALVNTLYYTRCKEAISNVGITLPPSCAIAGVYAGVDNDRGVWKAPANVSLIGVVGPSKIITDEDQQNLNVDVGAGKSINAIRSFTGKGTLVWGARTLAGNDNEWRYIPVRRFFIMVEESVKKASSQFVFEPNDANTWTKVRAMIENYLTIMWRQGALAGAKPEQAFYVHVGLNQTMSAIDILEGRMIIEIGMAAVRPAEFIVLRFSHKMQES